MFSGDGTRDSLSVGGSKLGTIFGADNSNHQRSASFTYTPPKQPRKKAPDSGKQREETPTVVISSVVHAYNYVDNKYVSQGKVGVALLTSPTTREYRILVYTKQQQLTSAKISPAFVLNIQENNYASFSDESGQTWSVMFETAEAVEKFAKEVTLARANSEPLTKLLQQDLSLGEGAGIEDGDLVEVRYTGWLLTDGAFGKVFDQSGIDNNFRFKVGKAKVIKGWDQGMLGMKKGGKRLLIIPPALAYGSQGVGERVPPDSALIFEVQVIRIKVQKVESPLESPAPTPAPVPLPSLVPVPDQDDFDEPRVKGRAKSFNDQLLHSPDISKAKLISRMARMGQPMLPPHGAGPVQLEDSDDEKTPPHVVHSVPVKPPPLPVKPRSKTVIGTSSHLGQVTFQVPDTGLHSRRAMVDSPPLLVSSTDIAHQQPAFLHNLPGSQQVAVYQNPNTFLQQQQQQQHQTALLQHQHQQQQAVILQQQQLLQRQQQLIDHSLSATAATLPSHAPVTFGVPSTPVPPPPQPAPTTSTTADSLAPVLLTETRQQYTDMNLGFSRLSDKVDRILEKMEQQSAVGLVAHTKGLLSHYGGNMPVPAIEATTLMQNVTRIVQENERLKMEILEQNNKVQEQNKKIAEMLERNQKYVEQSHSLLEQRNEGFKTSASQTQARVHALEQEKIQLATELSTATAQMSTLQLELGELRKREGELKQQLQTSTSLSVSTREELDRLRLQRDESDQRINHLSSTLRDEKQIRKSLEAKLANHHDELAEIRASKSLLEKNLTERQRKAAEDRQKMEKDLEETKRNFEKATEELQGKLRRQISLVDAEIHTKVAKAEEDMSREWQKKCDRLLATAEQQHKRQVLNLKDEKEELVRRVSDLETKLASIRSSGSHAEKEITQLKDELAEMKLWKDKYDHLRTQASSMKERHERRIKELQQEKQEEERTKKEIEEKIREQQQQLQQKLQLVQQEYDNHRKQTASLTENYERKFEQLEKEKEAEKEKREEVVEKARKLRLRQQQKIQQFQQQVQNLQSEILVLRESTLQNSNVSSIASAAVVTEPLSTRAQSVGPIVSQTAEPVYDSVQTDGATFHRSQTVISQSVEPSYASVQIPESIEPSYANVQIPESIEPSYASVQIPESVEPSYASIQIPGSVESVEPADASVQIPESIEPSYASVQIPESVEPSNASIQIPGSVESVESADASVQIPESIEPSYASVQIPESPESVEPSYASVQIPESAVLSSLSPTLTADSINLQTSIPAGIQTDVPTFAPASMPESPYTAILTDGIAVKNVAENGATFTPQPENDIIYIPYLENDSKTEVADDVTPRLLSENDSKTEVADDVTPRLLSENDSKTEVADDVTPRLLSENDSKTEVADDVTPRLLSENDSKTEVADDVTSRLLSENDSKTEVADDVTPRLLSENDSKTEAADDVTSRVLSENDVKSQAEGDVRPEVKDESDTYDTNTTETEIGLHKTALEPCDVSTTDADTEEGGQVLLENDVKRDVTSKNEIKSDVTSEPETENYLTSEMEGETEKDVVSHSKEDDYGTPKAEMEDVVFIAETESNVVSKTETENDVVSQTKEEDYVTPKTETEKVIILKTETENNAISKVDAENDVLSGAYAENKSSPNVNSENDIASKVDAEKDVIYKVDAKIDLISTIDAENNLTSKTNEENDITSKDDAENDVTSQIHTEHDDTSLRDVDNDSDVVTETKIEKELSKPVTGHDVALTNEAEDNDKAESDVISEIVADDDVSSSDTTNNVVSTTDTTNDVVSTTDAKNDFLLESETEKDIVLKSDREHSIILNTGSSNDITSNTESEDDVGTKLETQNAEVIEAESANEDLSRIESKNNAKPEISVETIVICDAGLSLEEEIVPSIHSDHLRIVQSDVSSSAEGENFPEVLLEKVEKTQSDVRTADMNVEEADTNVEEADTNVEEANKSVEEVLEKEVRSVEEKVEKANKSVEEADNAEEADKSLEEADSVAEIVEEADKSVEEADKNEEEVDKSVEEADKSVEEADKSVAENVEEADKNVEEADKNAEEADKNVEETDKNAEEADKGVEETGKNAEEADKNVEETDKNAEETDKNAEEADKSVEETDKNAEEADKNVEETDKNAEEADKSVEETDKNVEEADKNVEIAERGDISLSLAKENNEGKDPTEGQGLPNDSTVVNPELISVAKKSLPLFGDREDGDEDSLLFGSDNTVFDTFGEDFKPKPFFDDDDGNMKPVTKYEASRPQGRTDRKSTPGTDEPLPRSLFDDDDDDDELDWLS